MDVTIDGLVEQATAALVPLLLGIVGLAVRTWMQTHSHKAALAAVEAALARSAAVAMDGLARSKLPSHEAAVAAMVEYVARAYPDTISKLAPAAGALEQMAHAVLLQNIQARTEAK